MCANHLRVTRQAVRSSRRRTPSTHAKRVSRSALTCSVRLSTRFHWELLLALSAELSSVSCPSLVDAIVRVARSGDTSAYLELDREYGLKNIARTAVRASYSAAADRMLTALLRKYVGLDHTDPKTRVAQAVESVKAIELDHDLMDWEKVDRDETLSEYLKTARTVAKEILGAFPGWGLAGEHSRHGPGSSTVHAYTDRSAYFKFAQWPYVCTPQAGPLLQSLIESDPRWVSALQDDYRLRYKIPVYFPLDLNQFWRNVIRAEDPSNEITTVPKDGTKDRTIAKEPPGNVLLQLGLDGLIRKRLARHGNPIDDDQKNRALALRASVPCQSNPALSLATIDLSDASDRIHIELARRVLPSDWFEAICSVRCPWGRLPDKLALRLAKLSSMGNATTFVVETVIFRSLSIAACRVSNVPRAWMKYVTVFGDDIILPSYVAPMLIARMENVGLVPNPDKSFIDGPVRESCGVDAFMGVDIRPVFMKEIPKSDRDLYDLRNRLNLWWYRHMGCSLPGSVDQVLFKHLANEILLGPISDTNTSGWVGVDCYMTSVVGYHWKSETDDARATGFYFRRLMHSLDACSGEGGRFLVKKEAALRVKKKRFHLDPSENDRVLAKLLNCQPSEGLGRLSVGRWASAYTAPHKGAVMVLVSP